MGGQKIAADDPVFNHPSYTQALAASLAEDTGSEEFLDITYEPSVLIDDDSRRIILGKLVAQPDALRAVARVTARDRRFVDDRLRDLQEAARTGKVNKGGLLPFIDRLFPLGYFLIERARSLKMPVFAVTSPHHGGAAPLLLGKLGMASYGGLLSAYEDTEGSNREARTGNVIFGKSEQAYAEAYEEVRKQ